MVAANHAGIYGLFRLDQASLSATDAATLGFIAPDGSAAVRAQDRLEHGTVHLRHDAMGSAVLLGHIVEAEGLAARLGLDVASTPLDLALAALARFGNDLPREMLGGWVLLRWETGPGRLTIAKSINQGAPVLIARHGPHLAIAPDLVTLASLSWVDDAIDPAVLPGALASYRLTPDPLAPTILRQVRLLGRCRVARFDASGETVFVADPRLPTERWQGGFDDAVEAAEALLTANISAVLARGARPAALLSGGLDSSLLAWLVNRASGGGLPCLSSAVAPERGFADEVSFARQVTEAIGAELHRVEPDYARSPFLPRVSEFMAMNGPPRSIRHFFYNRAHDLALASGATHLFDGVMGELTVTSHDRAHPGVRYVLASVRAALRHRLRSGANQEQWPDAAFACWLAPEVLAQLPPDWIAARQRQTASPRPRRQGEPWGYTPVLDWVIHHELPDPAGGRVREQTPFLDIRLQRLFAGMPADFACQRGVRRAPARAMLRGQLPDEIVLRRKAVVWHAEHIQQLRDHAQATLCRLPLYRAAGIGAWIDLGRIEAMLARPETFRLEQLTTIVRMQLGVQAAEYLLWWQAGRPVEETRP